VGKTEGKRRVGRPRGGCGDKTKMNVTGIEVCELNHLAQVRY
jgi:hypothetical protein